MSWLMTKPTNDLCAQQRLRSALASAQFDQSLCCPYEEALGPRLSLERTAKTLIRLGECPGWSESLLGAKVILLVLLWGGSNGLAVSLFVFYLPVNCERQSNGSWEFPLPFFSWCMMHLNRSICSKDSGQSAHLHSLIGNKEVLGPWLSKEGDQTVMDVQANLKLLCMTSL